MNAVVNSSGGAGPAPLSGSGVAGTGSYKVDISRGERLGGFRPSGFPGRTMNVICPYRRFTPPFAAVLTVQPHAR